MMWQWTVLDVGMLCAGGFALLVTLAIVIARKIEDRRKNDRS
jgi:hypothetical protein